MNGELVGYYPHENNQVLVPLPFLPSQIPHRIAGVHFPASGGTREQKKKNSVALVRERTIPTERPPPVGEVSAPHTSNIPRCTLENLLTELRKTRKQQYSILFT